MNNKKIAYLVHKGETYYLYVERALKRFYKLTKDKEMATPLNEEDQKAVADLDNRVKFLD